MKSDFGTGLEPEIAFLLFANPALSMEEVDMLAAIIIHEKNSETINSHRKKLKKLLITSVNALLCSEEILNNSVELQDLLDTKLKKWSKKYRQPTVEELMLMQDFYKSPLLKHMLNIKILLMTY